MPKLYANNMPHHIDVSDEDMAKIGRGYEIGHSFGLVTDMASRTVYEAFQDNCSLPNCACAIRLEEL